RRRGVAIDSRRCRGPSEAHEFAPRVIFDELAHLVDRLDAVPVAILLRVAPGEEPMAAEHDAVASRLFRHRVPQHQRQLETGTLPGHPDDPSAIATIELLQLVASVGARR